MIHETYLRIIQKHIGSKLIMVYVNSSSAVAIEPIMLNNADRNGVTGNFIKSGISNEFVPFYNVFDKVILCLYNTNGIDLLKAKEIQPLSVKLKDKTNQKVIISSLKQTLSQKVVCVIKTLNEFATAQGIFENMGIAGISINVPPFYNRQEVLKYQLIYNIFDSKYNDLINID